MKYTVDELTYCPTFAEAALAYFFWKEGIWKDLNSAQVAKIRSNMFEGFLNKQQSGELRGALNRKKRK